MEPRLLSWNAIDFDPSKIVNQESLIMSSNFSEARRRVLDTLNHNQPTRVPMDFGSTMVTGIHVSVVAALRE